MQQKITGYPISQLPLHFRPIHNRLGIHNEYMVPPVISGHHNSKYLTHVEDKPTIFHALADKWLI